MRVRIEP